MQATVDFNRSFTGLKANPSTDPAALAAAIEARVRDLESRADAMRSGRAGTSTPGTRPWVESARLVLRELADRRRQLAELRGEPAPPAADLDREVADAIATAGGPRAVASLAARARARLAHVRQRAASHRQALSSPGTAFDPAKGLKRMQENTEAHQRALDEAEAEGARLAAVLEAFDAALARLAAKAVGPKAEAEEAALAVAELAVAEAPDPERRLALAAEIAGLDARVARLAAFRSKGRKTGVVADLENRKAELSAELAALDESEAGRAIADARRLVASAQAGEMPGVVALAAAVARRPASFRPGLGEALASAVLEALRAGDPADWLAVAEADA